MNSFGPRIAPLRPLVAALALCACAPFASAQESGLSVDAFGVGTKVVDHRLEGEADQFDEGTQVVFWTRVVGGSEGQRIRHVWLREGEEVVSIGLTIGGGHWRTYSKKTMYPGSAGKWVVEARDESDKVLARSEFTCVPAGAAEATDGGDS